MQTSPARHPIAAAHAAMVAKLGMMIAPRIYVNPTPGEFEEVNCHLLDVARIVDEFILEVGREVKSNATTTLDMSQFTNVLRDAIEGNATFAVSQQAETIREDRAA